MTYLIVCSGTAGHINPGLCIAEEIKSRLPDSEIIFIGTGRELEKRLIPEAGFKLINIKMSGIKRGIKPSDIIYNIKTVINVLAAKKTVKKLLKNTKPEAVIGTGGYICYPVIKAAAKMKIPTFIHESNAMPGMSVKMLSAVADKVMISFEGYDRYYKKPQRLVLTGTPLKKEFYTSIEETGIQQKEGKPLVVSFWGSLGSERMNEIMAGFIKRNIEDKSFYHIHATGNSFDVLTQKLAENNITEFKPPYADIREYINDMPVVMSKADLVICRAGAITITELLTLGKPSIIIPSPYVPDNVQQENAKQLEQIGAAIVIEESLCNDSLLYETTKKLILNTNKLDEMAQAAKKLTKSNATVEIVDLIQKCVQEQRRG